MYTLVGSVVGSRGILGCNGGSHIADRLLGLRVPALPRVEGLLLVQEDRTAVWASLNGCGSLPVLSLNIEMRLMPVPVRCITTAEN